MKRNRGKREARRRGRRQRPAHAPLVAGTLALQPDGSGRLQPDELEQPRVYVPPEELAGLRSGDRLTVRLEVGRKGRVKGRVVARGERLGRRAVGIVNAHRGAHVVDPIPPGPAILVDKRDLGGARPGDAVEVTLHEQAHSRQPARARVEEVLGCPDVPAVQVEMVVRSQGLPLRFSEAALAEAEEAADPASDPAPLAGRRDLREIVHVTIDGADARDFDDAVAAVPESDGFRLWVSIADVSHYVRSGGLLDEAARERGTSVYFPHRAIPMLPERLSAHVCSLVPGAPRFALTCEMRIRPGGRRQGLRIYPSLIRSAARLTYREVQAALDGTPPGRIASLAGLLASLRDVSRMLRRHRAGRGAVDLDLPEAELILGADGTARHVRERARLEAHRIIEDLMIAANESVAEHLQAHGIDTVYRVHAAPDPKRIEELVTWADAVGIGVETDPTTPRGLSRLAAALQGRPEAAAGQLLLLRSMAQARYGSENLGHFALASRAYLHFTSPIRRYPDLVVHRSLRALWRDGRAPRGLAALAERASLHERRAMEAERAVEQLMACHVAQQHLGRTLSGIVVGAHRAGAFVRCSEPFIEGLIPMETLDAALSDSFDVVEDEHLLLARRSGLQIGLGTAVEVRVDAVDTRFRQIDFELVGVAHARGTRKAGAKPRGTRARGKPGRRSGTETQRNPGRGRKTKPSRRPRKLPTKRSRRTR